MDSRPSSHRSYRPLVYVVLLLATAVGFLLLKKQRTNHAQERAIAEVQFELGKVWLERARAKAGAEQPDYFAAAMLAGRAIGFDGFGRDSNGRSADFAEDYPRLIQSSTHPALVEAVQSEIIDYLTQVHLPLWSPPANRHHKREITALSFSPDDKLIRSLGSDGNLRLWDSATGKSAGDVKIDYPGGIQIEAISPNGRVAVIVNNYDHKAEDAAFLFDIVNQQKIAGPLRAGESVYNATFSPDGHFAAIIGDGVGVVIWDIRNGKELSIGPNDPFIMEELESVIFSPDSQFLLISDDKDDRVLWDTKTWAQTGDVFRTRGEVAFSPDSSCLATVDADRSTIRLLELPSARPIGMPMQTSSKIATSLCFSPDGKILAVGTDDGTILLFDPLTGKRLRLPLEGHTDQVLSLAFSADGKTLISGSQLICVWDVSSGKRKGEEIVEVSSRAVYSWGDSTNLVYSPDGKLLASWGTEQALRVWDANTGTLLQQPSLGASNLIHGVSFCPDNRMLVVASSEEGIRVWDGLAGIPISDPIEVDEDNRYGAQIREDGRFVALIKDRRTACLLNLTTGKTIGYFRHLGGIAGMAFSPDGHIFVTSARRIHFWDTKTGEALREPIVDYDARGLAFTSDSKVLYSGSSVLRRWNIASGEELGDYVRGRAGTIYGLRFSSDPNTLLVRGQSGAEFWRVVGDEAPRPIHMKFGGAFAGAGFNADGNVLTIVAGNIIDFVNPSTGQNCRPPIIRSTDRVSGGAVFSPDGTRVAGAVSSNSFVIWDAGTVSPDAKRGEIDLAVYLDQGRYRLDQDGLTFSASRLDHLFEAKVYPMVNVPR
ncbi:MAG: WD40 repeat protein [Verrucomicrobiales bacterium]|jgi:WD40 repeat protein